MSIVEHNIIIEDSSVSKGNRAIEGSGDKDNDAGASANQNVLKNSTFQQLADAVRGKKTFAVCGHVNPDGDSIGSVLAVFIALKKLGKNVVALLSNGSKAPSKYSYILGFEHLCAAEKFEGSPDVFICVDTPNIERIGEASKVMQRCQFSIQIDHHPGAGIGANLAHIDPTSASASMLVWQFCCCLLGRTDADIANACYTGLVTDTGRFQFQNTDARALKCASELVEAGADASFVATQIYQNSALGDIKLQGRLIERIKTTPKGLISYSYVLGSDYEELGVNKEDTEDLVDIVRSVAGAKVSMLIRGRSDSVRCSIRAKTDLDVSLIAAKFGGGGHKAASGFTIKKTFDEAYDQIVGELVHIENIILSGQYPEEL